jgi:uncharacterized protein
MAASAEGSRDAIVGVLGMITGAGIYVTAYDRLESVGLALGDYGKVTVPDALGVPPWLVIVALAFVVAITLWIIERHKRRGTQGPNFGNRVDQRPPSWNWPRAERPTGS